MALQTFSSQVHDSIFMSMYRDAFVTSVIWTPPSSDWETQLQTNGILPTPFKQSLHDNMNFQNSTASANGQCVCATLVSVP
eukprot:1558895-Amphidinium_carterae.1